MKSAAPSAISLSILQRRDEHAQCEALRAAYRDALRRPTRVLVLMGGADFWSNGIHLGQIEAAASPADESWRNINAMNDLVRDIIETTDRVVVAVLRRTPAPAACSWRSPPTSLGLRQRRAQSALQGHGQSLRLGILDLPAAAPRRA